MTENARAGQGSVLLDIGGDVGALVVRMPPSMVGAEIELAPVGESRGRSDGHSHGHAHGHTHRRHVAVVERPVGGGFVPSLVFAELLEGDYELYDEGGHGVRLTAPVRGGQVTFAEWTEEAGDAV